MVSGKKLENAILEIGILFFILSATCAFMAKSYAMFCILAAIAVLCILARLF
jgi:hypothetical protein